MFIIAFLVLACSCKETLPELSTTFPIETWQERTPEELQIDSRRLHEALEYWASAFGDNQRNEIFIVRKGFVLYQGDSIYKKHDIHSSATTFTSTVLGLLSDLNMVHDYTRTRYIDPDLEAFYPELQMKYFASMTSGYRSKSRSYSEDATEENSLTLYTTDTPLFEPGTEFNYSNEAQWMFARLLTKRAKKTLKEVFDDHIGKAIGMGKFEWESEGAVDSISINKGYTGVVINAEQLARLGHLFLNEGHWNGQHLLSRYYINKATSNQVNVDKIAKSERKDIDGRGCYGYNWWLNGMMTTGEYHMPDAPKSLYYTSGLHTNVCFVIPEWDMVLVRVGVDDKPKKEMTMMYNEFFKRMALAIEK